MARVRFIKLLGCIVGLWLLSIGSVLADASNAPPDIALIQKRGALRVAVYAGDAAPLAMRDKNGNWSGIEIDLAERIASQLEVKLTVVPVNSYNEMVDLVASGQADLSSELAIIPGRALRASFTHPYYTYQPHLLINRLQAARYGWNQPTDIIKGLNVGKAGLKMGVLANSASVELMQQAFPNITIVQYPDIRTALLDVTTGKIFAAMGTTPVEVQKFLQTDAHASLLGEDVAVPQMKILVAVAVPWQYFHLRELLNNYFDYMIANGEVEKIFQKYGETTT